MAAIDLAGNADLTPAMRTWTVNAPAADPVFVGAGDIAGCSSSGDEATAALLDKIPGTVFTVGDNAYENGTSSEYANCYNPSWGRQKSRTLPVAGNHEYQSDPKATGYYHYFGAAAGDPTKGYYDTTVGAWHVIVLNSNCAKVGGCGAGSAQEQWLRSVLAASSAPCTVAIWHHPRFSSGATHSNNLDPQAFWQALYDYGADVVINGHDHVYERFGFQNPAGKSDAAFGIRQFTVGTSSDRALTGGPVSGGMSGGGRIREVSWRKTMGALFARIRAGPPGGVTVPGGLTACCEGPAMFLPTRTSRRARLPIVVATGMVALMIGPVRPAPAATGATRVASTTSTSSSAKTSITVKRPAGTAAGQVMVAAIVMNDDEPAFTAPAGWTVVRDDSVPGKLRQTIYVKAAAASEPTSYTWTLSDRRRIAGGITTYAGVDTTQPVDAHGASANPTKTTAVTAPSITTSVAGDLLVDFAAIDAEGSLKPPSGMTARWQAAAPNKRMASDALASSSDSPLDAAGETGPRTATATKAGPGIGALLALRAGPLTTPPSTDPPPPTPPSTDPTPPTSPPGTGDPVLVGAGDIANCVDNSGAKATSAVLDHTPGTVFTLGDNVYVDGTPEEFRNCYDPVWGRHKARTGFAVAGNHDYNTPGAAGFYGYFGAAAGDPAKGYYDTTVGSWHVIVLNTNCEEVGGCGAGSPQEQWLRSVLAASPAECTLTMWHQPAFTSGTVHRAFPTYQPLWQALYDYGAEVILDASDHLYERFGFQTPTGDADAVYGIRQFTVGTGGRSHQSFKTVVPNSEVRNGSTYGILKLTLHSDSYDWQFVPEAGKTFTDTGTSACHGTPPAPAPEAGLITRVGSSSNSAAKAKSLTLGRPLDTAPGQTMLASIVIGGHDPVLGAPDGWTVLRQDALSDELGQTIYVKIAGEAEPAAYTWNFAERHQIAGGLTTYAGVDTVQPVDAAGAASARTAGVAITAPSVTTTVDGARLVHFAAANGEGTLIAPDGMAQRWLAAAPIGSTDDALAASSDATAPLAGPTGPRSATATEPAAWIAVVVALRPAPG
ncbi:MAG: metallophosphoesterase [Actinobacteria bacterium]|nr:metallophosphoesterase [Actinomycetota bacterium]